MGKASGFMEYGRETATRRPVAQRVNDWFEIYQDFSEEKLRTQGARCMDCGVPVSGGYVHLVAAIAFTYGKAERRKRAIYGALVLVAVSPWS